MYQFGNNALYVLQDNSKSRIALYQALLENNWDTLIIEKPKTVESSESKKRRLELIEKLKVKKAEKAKTTAKK